MDIQKFLDKKPDWGYLPALYIVKQNVEGNNAYRCGLSGGMQFKDSDRVYGSDKPGSLSGLLSRMSMYMGFWTNGSPKPFGIIYAALQIKSQLVALPDQRLGTDSSGNVININNASQTLVRVRERDFHDILDSRNLRWDKERKNELFVPKKNGVEDLISAMRQVQGEKMYVFSEDNIREDVYYKGGSKRAASLVVNTSQKSMQSRIAAEENRAPSITIKLSRKAIEELKSDSLTKFTRLLKLIDEVDDTKKVNSSMVTGLNNTNPKFMASAVSKLVKVVAPRRSGRLAKKLPVKM